MSFFYLLQIPPSIPGRNLQSTKRIELHLSVNNLLLTKLDNELSFHGGAGSPAGFAEIQIFHNIN